MKTLPDEILQGIGRVVVNSARLEHSFQVLIWVLLGVDQRIGQTVTCEMAARGLRALTASLMKERSVDGALADRVNVALSRAEKAERRRNNIVHSNWLLDDQGRCARVKITAKQNRGWELHQEWLDSAALNDLAREFLEIAKLVQDVMLAMDENEVVKCGMLPPPGPEHAGEVRIVRARHENT